MEKCMHLVQGGEGASVWVSEAGAHTLSTG
jgi:hypothetical protein